MPCFALSALSLVWRSLFPSYGDRDTPALYISPTLSYFSNSDMEMERLIDRLSQLESELVKQRGRNSQARIVVTTTITMTIVSIW